MVPTTTIEWGDDLSRWVFSCGEDAPVSLAAIGIAGGSPVRLHGVPAVEILTADSGHTPASGRLAHTALGAALRYVDHDEWTDGIVRTLMIRQRAGGVEARLHLEAREEVAAVRARVVVTNAGSTPLVLRAVSSWSAGFTAGDEREDPLEGWQRVSGVSDWLGEGRWTRTALRGPDFPVLAEELTGQNPRGALVTTSDGTWSTGHHLPTGILESPDSGVAWQIEHNGAWRAETGEDTGGGYLSLSGPTDADSGWTRVLPPGASFETVPVSVAVGADGQAAWAALCDHRRASRRPHPDNTAMPVVFNDYMNTLDGDPTTEKLLPLVRAAADVGCEVFCIDAGWYDDSGHWWDTVGEWMPSVRRFPNGITEVLDAIREAGMTPGLWLEPEVVGVQSPVAARLPDAAFFQRHGVRIVEHHRYHLDLRHPAARAHLDAVIDRLVGGLHIGFLKLDYNINPGPGTDVDADSVGDGLLGHNRAHLNWLDGVLDRHPDLIIENCSSGAMRMDYALLSRVAMQSTSDQQDFRKYPAIAAAAPLSILPEQAASWAYPQPGMTPEDAAFCLVTGLLGRFYLSGHLNEMTPAERTRVTDAITVARRLREEIPHSEPYWPTDVPGWTDDWISLGLRAPRGDLVSVWKRGASTSAVLSVPHLRGRDVTAAVEFPRDLPAWRTEWDASAGTLTLHATGSGSAARTFRLTHPHTEGAIR